MEVRINTEGLYAQYIIVLFKYYQQNNHIDLSTLLHIISLLFSFVFLSLFFKPLPIDLSFSKRSNVRHKRGY